MMTNMKFLNLVGNSFGCSASGERLVSAARDGDFLEAKALLEYNPRLARYSTFGVNNSPLHYSAAQGHHEIVSLLIESGVDINLRNNRGQTALMQACQYGHWEVVQILILLKANIHRAACLNGGTALHFAALNGHSRCIRLLLADYIPSISNFYCPSKERSLKNGSDPNCDKGTLCEIVNRRADGGLTALHMSALNGHAETVHLLLDLGASVSNRTLEDGANIDLICAGSTPLHYAACGGNTQCCQLLIARGASLTAENGKGCTPLMVARSWRRDWLEDILSENPGEKPRLDPSPYLCLPLRSILLIARECGWRSDDSASPCLDPCAVCLERKCSVAAEGCLHEFCTQCALYLCSTSIISNTSNGIPGSIPCPLCRQCIISFTKLTCTKPLIKQMVRTRSLSCCTRSSEHTGPGLEGIPLCRPEFACSRLSQVGCHGFLSMKFSPGLCLGTLENNPDMIQKADGPGLVKRIVRSSKSGHRRSNSQDESGNGCVHLFNRLKIDRVLVHPQKREYF